MTPETYWIHRKEDVIGMDVLRERQRARQAATYQAIAQWIVNHSIVDILDVGCNIAGLKLFLDDAGYAGRYFGMDSNPFALAIARRHAFVMEGTLRKLGFQERWFEAVVIKDVLEHLESYHPLAEAFRVSAQYVIVATYLPFHDAPSIIVQHPDGYYTNTYKRKDVVQLGEAWGFEYILDSEVFETNGTKNAVYVWRRA